MTDIIRPIRQYRRITLPGVNIGDKYLIQKSQDGSYTLLPCAHMNGIIRAIGQHKRIPLPGATVGDQYLIKMNHDGSYTLLPVRYSVTVPETRATSAPQSIKEIIETMPEKTKTSNK